MMADSDSSEDEKEEEAVEVEEEAPPQVGFSLDIYCIHSLLRIIIFL